MKTYTIKELSHLREALSYMNEGNFKNAMNMIGEFEPYVIKEKFRSLKSLHFLQLLEEGDETTLKAILAFHSKVVSKVWNNCFVSNRTKVLKKIVFTENKEEGSSINYSEEIDLNTYEGAKIFAKIHEDFKVVAVLNLCDTVNSGNGKYVNIYEGDLVAKSDSFSPKRSGLYMAFIDGNYTNSPSYYKKIIFTEEFGFLNPANDKPLMDEKKIIRFEESVFNTEKGTFNYHCITLGDGFQVVGNLISNQNFLKNYQHESN